MKKNIKVFVLLPMNGKKYEDIKNDYVIDNVINLIDRLKNFNKQIKKVYGWG